MQNIREYFAFLPTAKYLARGPTRPTKPLYARFLRMPSQVFWLIFFFFFLRHNLIIIPGSRLNLTNNGWAID